MRSIVLLTCVLSATSSLVHAQNDAVFSMEIWKGETFHVGKVVIQAAKESEVGQKLFAARSSQIAWLGADVRYSVARRISTPTRGTWTIRFLVPAKKSDQLWECRHGVSAEELTASIVRNDDRFKQELDRWWVAYMGESNRRIRSRETDTTVELVVSSYLRRKLNLTDLRLDKVKERLGGRLSDLLQPNELVSTFLGTHATRSAMQSESMQATGDHSVANLKLPQPAVLPDAEVPEAALDIPVEAIALTVPPELLYSRYRSAEHLELFLQLASRFGADARAIATEELNDYGLVEKVRRQLGVEDQAFSQLLSPEHSSGLAILAGDLFFREGASVGLLIEARDSSEFGNQLKDLRKKITNRESDTQLLPFTISGQEVGTQFSRGDHQRSGIYVMSGDYHLLTTSARMAERWLQTVGAPTKSLGALQEFRHARETFPLDRQDDLFVHVTDVAIRKMISPAFRIEMHRRAVSENELQLLDVAQKIAVANGHMLTEISDLVDAGYLPSGFGKHSDGGSIVIRNGLAVDTLRGPRGFFKPVEEVDVTAATSKEVERYTKFVSEYRRMWNAIDPATFTVTAKPTADGLKLTADAYVYPIPKQQYGLIAGFAGKPSTRRLIRPPSVVAMLQGNLLGLSPAFCGVMDHAGSFDVVDDKVVLEDEDSMEEQFFLGASSVKNRGLLMAEIPETDEPVKMEKLIVGREGYQMRNSDLAVQSRTAANVKTLLEELKFAEDDFSAQFWLSLADFRNTTLADVVSAYAWTEALTTDRQRIETLNRICDLLCVSPDQSMQLWSEIHRSQPRFALGIAKEQSAGPEPARLTLDVKTKWSDYGGPLEKIGETNIGVDLTNGRIRSHATLTIRP